MTDVRATRIAAARAELARDVHDTSTETQLKYRLQGRLLERLPHILGQDGLVSRAELVANVGAFLAQLEHGSSGDMEDLTVAEREELKVALDLIRALRRSANAEVEPSGSD